MADKEPAFGRYGANANGLEYWESRWKSDQRKSFQMSQTHPLLIKFFDQLTTFCSGESASGNKTVFVPLCGKSPDIAYLLSRGLKVFAIEGVRQPIEELEQEYKFGLKFNEKDSIYETGDKRLIIYFGDFFNCPVEKWGPFDCVWDRGSFSSIDYSLRDAYIKIIRKSLKQYNGKYTDFRYLLSTMNYDKTKFAGPPRSIDETDIQEYYADWANVQILSETKIPDDSPLIQRVGGDFTISKVMYLITPLQ